MAMLQTILDRLRARLEAALQISEARTEPWVALTNPVDPDGRVAESARNKMVMVLVGLQSDPALGALPRTTAAAARAAPPLHLNALVMLIANFSGSDYATGLGMLSRTITFFHQNPVFIPDPLPGLPPDNIVLDFVNIDLAQTRDLAGMLGLTYLPSALYRMRSLTFSSDAQPAGATPARIDRGLQRAGLVPALFLSGTTAM
jgi:hypothetical protein